MKLSEFLSLGLHVGQRVTVQTTDGAIKETTYDGLYSTGGRITNPDIQLQPLFRAPTLVMGGGMAADLGSIKAVIPDTIADVTQRVRKAVLEKEYPAADEEMERILSEAVRRNVHRIDTVFDYTTKVVFQTENPTVVIRIYYNSRTGFIGNVEVFSY